MGANFLSLLEFAVLGDASKESPEAWVASSKGASRQGECGRCRRNCTMRATKLHPEVKSIPHMKSHPRLSGGQGQADGWEEESFQQPKPWILKFFVSATGKQQMPSALHPEASQQFQRARLTRWVSDMRMWQCPWKVCVIFTMFTILNLNF